MKWNGVYYFSLFVLLIACFYVFYSSYNVSQKKYIDIEKHMQEHDALIVPVAIIGSGPAGCMAGLYVARGGFETIIFEGDHPGGALMGTSIVENWPGFKSILGPDVMKQTKNQAKNVGVHFVQSTIQSINTRTFPFELITNDGKKVYALSVIVAAGSMPRLLDIPGEKKYWGKGVTTCAVCDAPFHKDKDVVVVGGGDSALEQAIQLSKHVKSVTIVVRKNYLRASALMQERLQAIENVSILFNSKIIEIVGKENFVTHVVIDVNEKRIKKDVSGVFIAIGHIPNTVFCQGMLPLNARGYINVNHETQETVIKGIFAAGDIADEKYMQASTAMGDGVKAALNAIEFLQDFSISKQVYEKIKKNIVMHLENKTYVLESINSLDTLHSKIKKVDKPVLIELYALYCPSCLAMLPHLESLAGNFANDVIVVKGDVEQAPNLARFYGISSLPTLLLFNPGDIQPVAVHTGYLNKRDLKSYLNNILHIKE